LRVETAVSCPYFPEEGGNTTLHRIIFKISTRVPGRSFKFLLQTEKARQPSNWKYLAQRARAKLGRQTNLVLTFTGVQVWLPFHYAFAAIPCMDPVRLFERPRSRHSRTMQQAQRLRDRADFEDTVQASQLQDSLDRVPEIHQFEPDCIALSPFLQAQQDT
jgi:hypothetical protein